MKAIHKSAVNGVFQSFLSIFYGAYYVTESVTPDGDDLKGWELLSIFKVTPQSSGHSKKEEIQYHYWSRQCI